MKTPAALDVLTALSHDARLRAFRALVQAGPEGLSVGELRERVAVPPATLSAHLNLLRAAALVQDTREGRVIRVRANYAQMNALIAYLTENCCAGSADRPSAIGPSACSPSACPPAKKGAAK